MKVKYTFRRRQWSNSLVEYAAKKSVKLKKYEANNSFKVTVTFMDEKNDRNVNLLVEAEGELYTAKSTTDNYFDSIDHSFEKVIKQIEKEKTKTKSAKMRRLKNEKANLHAIRSMSKPIENQEADFEYDLNMQSQRRKSA